MSTCEDASAGGGGGGICAGRAVYGVRGVCSGGWHGWMYAVQVSVFAEYVNHFPSLLTLWGDLGGVVGVSVCVPVVAGVYDCPYFGDRLTI